MRISGTKWDEVGKANLLLDSCIDKGGSSPGVAREIAGIKAILQ